MTLRPWAARLHLPTLGVALLLLAAWALLSRLYGAYVLPSPLQVVHGLAEVVRSGEIWRHTAASLGRILVGFGGAVLVALLMGLGAFLSRAVREVVGVGVVGQVGAGAVLVLEVDEPSDCVIGVGRFADLGGS